MTFQEIINQNKPVLVDFYADWCQPCKMQSPKLEQLKSMIKDDADIIKINVDKNEAVAQKYQIRSIPTMILFKNGELLWRESGVFEAEYLLTLIKKHL